MERDNMSEEQQRLSSFKDWPDTCNVFPTILAKAGFYYTGVGDEVRCFICHSVLRGSTLDHDKLTEHFKYSPPCQLIDGKPSDMRNIPMEKDPSFETQGMEMLSKYGNHHSQIQESTNAPQESPNRQVNAQRGQTRPWEVVPKLSSLRSEKSRLETFKAWPSQHIITSDELAKAGFYYLGESDRVECVYCGGVLRQWEEGDGAMSEHRRFFPNCPLVQGLACGNVNLSEAGAEDIPNSGLPNSRNNARREIPMGIDYHVDPREIKARLDTPPVRAILNMGYSRDIVKRCILERLRKYGDDFSTAERLLEAVLAMEEAQSQDEEQSHTEVNVPGFQNAQPQPKADPEPHLLRVHHTTRPHGATGGDKSGNLENKEKSHNIETEAILHENESLKNMKTCKVCMDAEIDIVFLPCGHLVCCHDCAPQLRKCPICRSEIIGSVRTNFS